MSPSFWSTFIHIFGWFSFFLSIWATVSLFVLIEKRSRKEIGSYKHFLRLNCFYALCYALIDWLVQPEIAVDIHGFGYVFYSENRLFDLGYSTTHLVQILYCGCFIASSSFLSLNFIYRYVSTCRKTAMKYFHGWGLIIWFLYCSLPCLFWALCVYQWMSPSPEITAHLNNTTMLFNRFDLTNRAYVAPLCRHVKDTPHFSYGDINWPTLCALLGLCVFQSIFYGISLICGTLTYRENMILFQAARLSPQLYRLQTQLLRAIVIQAIVPLISVYIPAAVIISGSVFGIYVGQIFGYLTVLCINVYPPLDTIVFLLSIRDYREALFCTKKYEVSGNVYSHNVSVVPSRPGTSKVSDISTRRIDLEQS